MATCGSEGQAVLQCLVAAKVMTETGEASGIALLDRDVKLKVWVPEAVYAGLTLLADATEVLRPEWVRYAFISHAFGRIRLERALQERRAREAALPEICFSRRALTDEERAQRQLGKSTVDAWITVSSEVHQALQRLAKDAGVPIGTYASFVIAWAVFGHGVHTSFARATTDGYLLDDDADMDAPAPRGEPR